MPLTTTINSRTVQLKQAILKLENMEKHIAVKTVKFGNIYMEKRYGISAGSPELAISQYITIIYLGNPSIIYLGLRNPLEADLIGYLL